MNIAALEFDPKFKQSLKQFAQDIRESENIWDSNAAHILSGLGCPFNTISSEIYDRVFAVPCREAYVPSKSDAIDKISFQNSQLGSLQTQKFIQFHDFVERIGKSICESSHQPGYTVTTKLKNIKRERIPVHTHQSPAEFQIKKDLTLSIALRLRKNGTEPARLQLFSSRRGMEHQRTHEKLISSEKPLSIDLDQAVKIFLFEAVHIPHTVLFSDDFVVWAVFNGVYAPLQEFDRESEVGYFTSET